MKTLRISDEAHGKLTATLGMLMAKTGKTQTYSEAIEPILKQAEDFAEKNKQFHHAFIFLSVLP